MEKYKQILSTLQELSLNDSVPLSLLEKIISMTINTESLHILVCTKELLKLTQKEYFPCMHGAARQSHYNTFIFPIYNSNNMQWECVVLYRNDSKHTQHVIHFHYHTFEKTKQNVALAKKTIERKWSLISPIEYSKKYEQRYNIEYHEDSNFHFLTFLNYSPFASSNFNFKNALENIDLSRTTESITIGMLKQFLSIFEHSANSSSSNLSDDDDFKNTLFYDNKKRLFVYNGTREYSDYSLYPSLCIFFVYNGFLPEQFNDSYDYDFMHEHITFRIATSTSGSSGSGEVLPLIDWVPNQSIEHWIANNSVSTIAFESSDFSRRITTSPTVVYIIINMYLLNTSGKDAYLFKLFKGEGTKDWTYFASFSHTEQCIVCVLSPNTLFFDLLNNLVGTIEEAFFSLPSPNKSIVFPNQYTSDRDSYIQLLTNFNIN